jgi:hypothetical protein
MNPVVHLELHTGDLPQARDLYAELCGWRPQGIETRAGSYLSLELGDGFGGGIIDELDVVRPGTVLVLGAVAYDAVARLDAFRAVPCRSRRGTLRRREWQADVYKVVHPSDPGGRAAPSELALIQHLRRVSTGRQRRVAPSTAD